MSELERTLTEEELISRGFRKTQHYWGTSEIHKNDRTEEVYLLRRVNDGYSLIMKYFRGEKV